MKKNYFGIDFEFDRCQVLQCIDQCVNDKNPAYIGVVDGVVLQKSIKDSEYADIISQTKLSICDSRWITSYLKFIYNIKYTPYYGVELFSDIISQNKYRMMFLGSTTEILAGLKSKFIRDNIDINRMSFMPLPISDIDNFAYNDISDEVNAFRPDIIWVSLGAPKQDQFISRMLPLINHGILIPVGAAFEFESGVGIKRAPKWMIRNNMEFLYRIFQQPRKQCKRCISILFTLPKMLFYEMRKSRYKKN